MTADNRDTDMNKSSCISDEDLVRLIEDSITEDQKQSFHQHLQACPECKQRRQEISEGVQASATIFDTMGRLKAQGSCLSQELMAEYVDQKLSPGKRLLVQDHLARCPRCQAELAENMAQAYEDQGEQWWSEYVGTQLLILFAQVPEEVDSLVQLIEGVEPTALPSSQVITLPTLEPAQTVERLAAATGEGFLEQTLHQDDPPFEFHLVQFGEQLRINVKTLDQDSPYNDCLARLELQEQEVCQCRRMIRLEKGKGQCVLEPDEVRTLRPQQEHLRVKLIPMVTLEQLASAGSEVYMPILSRLLKHENTQIRRSAIEVIARLYGSKTHSLIGPLANDQDETVRQAVRKALNQIPQS